MPKPPMPHPGEELLEALAILTASLETRLHTDVDQDAPDLLRDAATVVNEIGRVGRYLVAEENGFVARYDAYCGPSLAEASTLLEDTATELDAEEN